MEQPPMLSSDSSDEGVPTFRSYPFDMDEERIQREKRRWKRHQEEVRRVHERKNKQHNQYIQSQLQKILCKLESLETRQGQLIQQVTDLQKNNVW
jgi:hypothetical protein